MIHDENPFVEETSDREPSRRFRGRLANPVTIVTSGEAGRPAGLTVSSLVVVDGAPATTLIVVGPVTDLWEALVTTGRLVVHVCEFSDRGLADVFAGMRPSPGGPFATTPFTQSGHGPVIDALPDRLFCSVTSTEEVGYSGLVRASVDRVELSDLTDPLVHFRGYYRRLQDQ